WGAVWKSQEDLRTWPSNDTTEELRRKIPNSVFFTEIRAEERREFPKLYESQFDQAQVRKFYDLISPAFFLGGWRAVLRPVPSWKPTPLPTTEECWLAQEEYWVKLELLREIRKMQDSVAKFNRVEETSAEPLPKNVLARNLYRNSNWEFTLLVEKTAKG